MANRLTSNPLVFDQFDTDATFADKGESFIVTKIRWKSVADADKLQLEDFDGNVLFEDIQTAAGDWRDVNFVGGYDFGNGGVRIDVSDNTGLTATDGTDALYIYLK